MTRMILPTRAFMALSCAALSLVNLPFTTSRSFTPSIPNYATQIHAPSILTAAVFAALIPQANAYALPEMARLPYPNDVKKRERSRATKRHESDTPDCTDDDQASTITAVVAGHSSLEPVTVTVTVGLPNMTHSISITMSSGSSGTNGTVADGSTSLSDYASATRSSSSAVPTPTIDPLLRSAQEAQRLNLAFQSLSANDACTRESLPLTHIEHSHLTTPTAGERACISNQLAQCTTPSDPSDSARWVTQFCTVTSDPNQTPVCAAVPYSGAGNSSASMVPYVVVNGTASTPTTANTTTTVGLGCFNPTDLTRLFSAAGLAGELPPGAAEAQTNGAAHGGFGMGLGVLSALIAVMLF